jgi:hypothetical protein
MSFVNEIDFGETLLKRLHGAPPMLQKAGKDFEKALVVLTKAENAVVNAHAAHKEAVSTAAAIDIALHGALETLAIALAAAGITKRDRPFAGFTNIAPSKLVELGFKDQVPEVKKLTGAVLKKKPPAAVVESATKCAKLAVSLDKALKSRVEPDAQGAKDMRARNAAYLAYEQAVSKLRKFAKAAYADDPAAEVALFMPVAVVHHKAKATPAPTT